MRFIFKLTLFAVLALALTACGGGDSGGAQSNAKAQCITPLQTTTHCEHIPVYHHARAPQI